MIVLRVLLRDAGPSHVVYAHVTDFQRADVAAAHAVNLQLELVVIVTPASFIALSFRSTNTQSAAGAYRLHWSGRAVLFVERPGRHQHSGLLRPRIDRYP
jgi:hypothetical protein